MTTVWQVISFDAVQFHAIFIRCVVKCNIPIIAWTSMGCGFHHVIVGSRGALKLSENNDRATSVEGLPVAGISITIHTCVPGIGKYNTRLSIIIPTCSFIQ